MGLKQAFANVPLRSFFDSAPEVRALCSAGITRRQRSYGPVRLPVPAAIPSDGVGTKLHRHWVSLSNAICLPGMPCSLPRWTEPVRVSVASRLVLPSPFPRRVGVHDFAFEACSSFTRVTACRVARPPYSGLCHEASTRPVTRPGRSLATMFTKPKDRWDQFEKALNNGWFPENVRVTLSKGWLGGELWHNMFAARARMLEYALELEAKITDCKLAEDNTSFILALCGDGFHWHRDDLEDFVSFYRNGSHRRDDPFSKAETKYIADNHITLDKTIWRFACMNRSQSRSGTGA